MRNLLIIILSSTLLSGCAAGARMIDIISEPAPIVIQQPPPPRAVTMRKVEWKVLNTEILAELLEKDENTRFVALTSDGYNNLSLNMSELKRYLQQQKQIIIYYQNLTSGADIDTPEGEKWRFKDLNFLNDEAVTPNSDTQSIGQVIILREPLNLDYLRSD